MQEISIHLMFILIAESCEKNGGERDFNTSHVYINQKAP